METGETLLKIQDYDCHHSIFSPDGKRIVLFINTYPNHICIIDSKIGTELIKHQEDLGLVMSASFSPDGRYIVVTSHDGGMGTIRIIDAIDTGKEIFKLEVINRYKQPNINIDNYALFSPNGKQIISASMDVIKIWDFPSLQDLINQTVEQFKDCPLTSEERNIFYLD